MISKAMLIIVSGFPGSGKSVLVERLARRFRLKKVFASDILKQLKGKDIQKIDVKKTRKSEGWWESKEGKNFTSHRLKELKMDIALDKKLLEIIGKEKRVIIDSRTMPWLSKKGFKVWLNASEKVRAQRIAKRDKVSWKTVVPSMRHRLASDRKIYRKLYGFVLGKDFRPFNLVLNTEKLNEKKVFEKVSGKAEEFYGLKNK